MARKPINIEGLCEDVTKLSDLLNEATDAVAAIVGVSFLEATLGSLLKSYFKKTKIADQILSHRGILGTFQGRISMAYCLDLISKIQYQDLSTIAEIRNTFAHHHLELSFDNEEINKKCQELKFPETKVFNVGDRKLETLASSKHPRTRFSITLLIYANQILLEILSRTNTQS